MRYTFPKDPTPRIFSRSYLSISFFRTAFEQTYRRAVLKRRDVVLVIQHRLYQHEVVVHCLDQCPPVVLTRWHTDTAIYTVTKNANVCSMRSRYCSSSLNHYPEVVSMPNSIRCAAHCFPWSLLNSPGMCLPTNYMFTRDILSDRSSSKRVETL